MPRWKRTLRCVFADQFGADCNIEVAPCHADVAGPRFVAGRARETGAGGLRVSFRTVSTSEWDDEFETHVARTPRESRDALTLLAPQGPITIEGNETLGSAPDVTVRIVHPTVSRLHARLEVDERNATWIVDLDSTNGTFVDGLRVRAAALHPGAAVRLGDVELRAGSSTTTSTRALWPEEAFGALLGRSKSMRSLFERLAKAAASEATVLVQGETGVGKELVARALHEASSRSKGPFVVVDCGAIPEALFESELFGHARGAFTGADRPRDGAVDAAQGGDALHGRDRRAASLGAAEAPSHARVQDGASRR